MAVIISLAAALCLSLVGNVVLTISKKREKKVQEVKPVMFEKRDLQIETIKCTIALPKHFIEVMNEESLRKYLIQRVLSTDLKDFFFENFDLLSFQQTENMWTDEELFECRLQVVRPDHS